MIRVLLAVFLFAVGCTTSYEPHGTTVDPPASSPAFELDTADGVITNHDLEDKITVVFFGFTHCPDVCPETMSRLSRAVSHLDEREAGRIQGLFISLDPERDTGEIAARYASIFGPSFRGGVTGDEELSELAAAFGIFYETVPLDDEGNYTIDHSPYTFVLNPAGETILLWSFGITDDQMLEDLRHILKTV